jgi:hypothetical protein
MIRTFTLAAALLTGLAGAAAAQGDGFDDFQDRYANPVGITSRGGPVMRRCSSIPLAEQIVELLRKADPSRVCTVLEVTLQSKQLSCYCDTNGVKQEVEIPIDLPDRRYVGVSPSGHIVKVDDAKKPADPCQLVPTTNGMVTVCW